MDHVTLIVVPEANAPVRRVRVPRGLVRYGPVSLVLFALAFGALGADWVRLRRGAVEVAALRAKALDDQAALSGLAVQLRSVEARLGRVAEFERKVRIVADLPGGAAVPVAAEKVGSASAGSAAADGAPAGQGGEGGDDEPDAPVSGAVEAGLPASSGDAAEPERPPHAGLDGAVLERLRGKAEGLLVRAARADHSLGALLAALGERRERLAAMPSISPVAGWITSTFGWRRSPFTGRRQFHGGLDIAAAPGTAFVATAAGRVVFAGVRGSLGRAVIVDHGHGFLTTYGHASALQVHAGEQVERGEALGLVGSTGRSTGPHVHYAIRVRGRAADPADYLLD